MKVRSDYLEAYMVMLNGMYKTTQTFRLMEWGVEIKNRYPRMTELTLIMN